MGDVTLAVHQPNYLPWLGFFHKMSRADVFVFLDTVQFARRGYTHRVHVLGPGRTQLWLTQHVRKRAVEEQVIHDLAFSDRFWVDRHLKTFEASYGKAPYFDSVFAFLEDRLRAGSEPLARLNGRLILDIAARLGIAPRVLYASELPPASVSSPSERIAQIADHLGVQRYLSGSGARAYNDVIVFGEHGIELVYNDFKCMPYPQRNLPEGQEFVAGLSIVDALFNIGFDGVAGLLWPEEGMRPPPRTNPNRTQPRPGGKAALQPSL
ncbi:WbqC family protein [Noviherbaspirillum sp.]|uniref:WbqC family protein n=1 Tax=Noviherbaspirillum sp. TaxID=1926288 RepID=UPI002D3D825A|nr:WbqC family protein [Noviherbaspirillum sp.]HZW22824.1 WbqC family protein [Noviherbaspirillum sp.]